MTPLGVEQLADAAREDPQRLLEQALVGLVARERGGLEEALRLLRQVRERAAERRLVHLRDQLLERLLARAVRQQVHHVLRVGDHGVGERRDAAVLEVQDAIRDVEDAVVVGDEQDRRPLFLRQRLHPIDDLAARDCGRARRWARRRARWPDRPRAPARSRRAAAGRPRVRAARLSTCAPRPTASSIERARRRSSPRGKRPVGPEPELDVLGRRERGEQVVLLEDEADAAAHALERARVGAVQLLAEHAHAARLRGAQRADQRQQRRLARARRPRDDDDLAGRDRGRRRRTGSGGAARPCRSGGSSRSTTTGCAVAHPNTSAGSSLRTLRKARNPDSAQTASMMPNTTQRAVDASCAAAVAWRRPRRGTGRPTPRRRARNPAPPGSRPAAARCRTRSRCA